MNRAESAARETADSRSYRFVKRGGSNGRSERDPRARERISVDPRHNESRKRQRPEKTSLEGLTIPGPIIKSNRTRDPPILSSRKTNKRQDPARPVSRAHRRLPLKGLCHHPLMSRLPPHRRDRDLTRTSILSARTPARDPFHSPPARTGCRSKPSPHPQRRSPHPHHQSRRPAPTGPGR